MKAAMLKEFGTPLVIENLSDPSLGTGEVIVDVVAAPVLPYMNEVFSGERQYLLTLPLVPGTAAIGRVRAVGPDSTHLTVGDWVFCDPTVRSRDNASMPDITLQGLSARGEGGLRLQKYFRHGSFAQQILVPTENAIRVGPLDEENKARWCALGTLLVPFGGLLAANLKAGETILVSGATGNFGSACIALALAMGARCVVAPGRNEKRLEDLQQSFGSRVRPVKLTGSEEKDRKQMQQAAPDAIDCVLDILSPSADTIPVRAAAMAVRPYGKIVLMGGGGMLGGPGLDLPYPWIMRNCITIRGQWMYPTEAVSQLVALIRSGLLSLEHFEVASFNLDDANEAVEYAAANPGPFRMTVIQP